jgi:hypothetical protein
MLISLVEKPSNAKRLENNPEEFIKSAKDKAFVINQIKSEFEKIGVTYEAALDELAGMVLELQRLSTQKLNKDWRENPGELSGFIEDGELNKEALDLYIDAKLQKQILRGEGNEGVKTKLKAFAGAGWKTIPERGC